MLEIIPADFNVLALLATYLEPIVIGVIGSFLAAIYQRVTGRRLEQFHREALHSAVRTVVHAFVNRWLLANPGSTILDLALDKNATNALRDIEGPAYIRKSVPDAIRRLSPLPDVIDDLIVSYLPFNLTDGEGNGRG